jgi:molecular chaperone Hsp33
VQLLPGAPDERIETLEENIFLMDQLTTILDEDGPDEVIRQVLKGFETELLSEEDVFWKCPCSWERVAEALRSTGEETLRELAKEEKTEVRCQFCGKEYIFLPEDLLKQIPEE